MKTAPIDIAHKTFARKMMGYDIDEVTNFLRDLADQLEELVRERNNLKDTLRQKDIQLIEYRERDEVLRATLATATKMAEQIRIDAEREGKLVLQDAQQKAELIIKDGRDQLKRVYQEISDLKRVRMQFEVNLRSMIQAHVAMLDQSHITVPEPTLPSYTMTETPAQNPVPQAAAANGKKPVHPPTLHPAEARRQHEQIQKAQTTIAPPRV